MSSMYVGWYRQASQKLKRAGLLPPLGSTYSVFAHYVRHTLNNLGQSSGFTHSADSCSFVITDRYQMHLLNVFRGLVQRIDNALLQECAPMQGIAAYCFSYSHAVQLGVLRPL